MCSVDPKFHPHLHPCAHFFMVSLTVLGHCDQQFFAISVACDKMHEPDAGTSSLDLVLWHVCTLEKEQSAEWVLECWQDTESQRQCIGREGCARLRSRHLRPGMSQDPRDDSVISSSTMP